MKTSNPEPKPRFRFISHGPVAQYIVLCLLLASLCRADSPVITNLVPALGWDIRKQGAFPVSLASDAAGNLWVGTEGNGLWKYDPTTKNWTQFTTKDGLGDNCIYALAIDRQNRVWAGHLNHGVSVYNGGKWRNYGLIDGPISDRVFAIAVSPKDGNVWIATDLGLSRYSEQLQDWDYYTRASGLPSDQIQALTFDNKGQLYAGTQCDGIAIAGPDDNYTKWRTVTAPEPALASRSGPGLASNLISEGELKTQASIAKPATVFIRAALSATGQPPLFAAYDASAGGLLTSAGAQPYLPTTTGTVAIPPLPAPASAPAVSDAIPLGASVAKLTDELVPGEAYYLADDWRTQGDWIGRYGNGYAKLCGMATQGDQDYSICPGYQVSLQVGPHHKENAIGPVSYHDDETSSALSSLYDPTIGHRRDAQENDFSDDTAVYPESYDGPDLWVRVTVPDGIHCLNLYFVNDDAHSKSDAKYRDYDVTIVPASHDDDAVQAAAPLARTRVTDFWGGVYKQFLVCGPASFVVRIGRNRSFGTRLQAVFLDPATAVNPADHLPGFDVAPYGPPAVAAGYAGYNTTPLADAAISLSKQLDAAMDLRGAIPLQLPLRIWAYRAGIAGNAPPEILEFWRWQMSIWNPEDRKKFDDAMKAARNANK